MNTNGDEIIQDEPAHLLDELESTLKNQLELARQGDSASEKFDALTSRAGRLVEKITSLGVRNSGEFQSRWNRLRGLYGNLCLVVAAERSDICVDLARIRRGKKIIGTYRHTV